MMSKKGPQLRFEGFTDDWEERKLRDLLNKNSEKNKNLSVINVESVSNKTGFTKQTDQFEDYSVASADLSNYYVIREKQFAYNPSRINVGSIAYKDLGDEISVVSPLYVSFSTKKILNEGFLWNWFKTASFDAQRQRLSEGGVRDTLSFNQLSEMNTMFPTYSEQQQIGSFFKQLDNTIALHQHKLDLLKEQKKGYLQKMFPKNGAKVPELRFAGFADDWEERKLGEVFNQTVEYINPNEANLELWSVTVERGLTPKTARYNREALVKKNDKFKVVHDGDIVYNPMNLTIGAVGFNKSEKSVAVSGYYVTMNMNSGFNNSYFQTWLKSENAIKQYKLYATGSLIEKQRVQFPTLSLIKSYIPTFEEQQKIGSFFKQLDETIALHQRKLDLLKEQKKGFLQKMFV
ncbi:restriction endonuclease subunit S [Lactococcus petauri]|uniref:restriction endonuclease subunit S n=1 Tax=Lactococcus petauri TaxID=1940789 RepID=UPI0038540C28